jgi:hypothetical protein
LIQLRAHNFSFLTSITAARKIFRPAARDAGNLLKFTAYVALTAAAPVAVAQEISIPAGTPLPVQLGKHVPMKKGESLECRLIYSVYEDNRLVIPAGSVVRGRVIALDSDRSRRIHSRLWGDFTPFHIPVVRFDQLVLPDGRTEQIASNNATDGAPVLHLSPPVSRGPKSLIGQQIAQAKERAKSTIALVTAPGRKDRLVQFVYRQLPYHPERIETATTWTATLAQPLVLKANEGSSSQDEPAASVAQEDARVPSRAASAQAASGGEGAAWHIRAYLDKTISSASEKPGNTFEAVVAEPVFNPDHNLVVPEGSVLVGTITQAKPARSFGRAGKLRFDFRELKFPGEGGSQHVMGTLSAADASKAQQLQMDQEGGVQPKPQDRVIVPLVLTLLAGRTLSDDGTVAGNAAVGSNGFGAIGRVIGMAAGSRGVAAAIGFYGAGLSFSERWLVRGQQVSFKKNTRIEVTTVPSRNPLPAGAPETGSSEKH